MRPTPPAPRLLVVLDQFEEFLLYHGADWDPGAPGFELARAMNATDLWANFLIAIRQDAVAGLNRFKGHFWGLL